MRSLRVVIILGGLLVLVGGLPLPVAGGGDAAPWRKAALSERFPDPDLKADPKALVGPAECAHCHEDRKKSLSASFHAKVLEAAGSRGCEECHGPGAAHAEDGDGAIRNLRKAPAREVVGVCLRCHENVLTRPVGAHRSWLEIERPEPATRSCVVCHAVHVDRGAKAFDPALGPFRDLPSLAEHATHVTAERCRECHDRAHPEIGRSGHSALLRTKEACGTCHGPGSLHADSGGDPSKIVHPFKQAHEARIGKCLECHDTGKSVAAATCRAHAPKGISCVICHDVNAPKGRTVRREQALLCGTCHPEVGERLRLPSRHPVAGGKVSCTDCHNPPVAASGGSASGARRDACIECHEEFGGPFRHDHGIAGPEGCVACHDPHGSAHPRLLSHARVRDHCASCHERTPHDLSAKAEKPWERCTDCHIAIHGSDRDALFRR